MDYFENIVMKIIESDNKWVRQSVKVNVTKEEKRQIGKPSIPRPEIDIVSYQVCKNILEIWEVKSFLDSPGVRFEELKMKHDIPKGRYKILTSDKYREIVIKRLVNDWVEQGLILPDPIVKIGLAAGKTNSKDEPKIIDYFKERDWVLLTPNDIFQGLKKLENSQYENDPYIIASKIIFRNLDK